MTEMPHRLSAKVLVRAYCAGMFPMADEDGIGWYSPDPRAVISIETFRPGRTLRNVRRHHPFVVRVDTAFERVMKTCGDRPEGTWLSAEMTRAYVDLNRMGLAHSVECYMTRLPADPPAMSAVERAKLAAETLRNPAAATKLVGGLYGVSLGGAFFGESMFHTVTGASSVALMVLIDRLRARGFALLDTQWLTGHLERFAATYIDRANYLRILDEALHHREVTFIDQDAPPEIELPRATFPPRAR